METAATVTSSESSLVTLLGLRGLHRSPKSAAAAERRKRRKRRRALVKRTHSPKAVSCDSLATSSAAPTMQPTMPGIEQVHHYWKSGKTVAIPTECTYEGVRVWQESLQLPHDYFVYCRDLSKPIWHKILPGRQYILKQHKRVTFSEERIVLSRLAANLWPGPVLLHVRVQNRWMPLRCPSHPLAVRALKQDLLLMGRSLHQDNGKSCQTSQQVAGMAVLNGEVKKELFHVPPCEHGPLRQALYVDGRARTIRIVNMNLSSGTVEEWLRDATRRRSSLNSPPLSSTKTSVRRLVINAVLRKWKVIICDGEAPSVEL